MIGDVHIWGGEIHAQGGGYAAGLDVYGGAGIGGGGESPIQHVNKNLSLRKSRRC